ncbi:hypothetical protein [Bradyrhizobium sp.]|uniref:hypothetical protein n=1 Tax=Bradyrhizobium sp. TaxID=376 RepID=UPI002B62CBFA|nr:hypothetical protein [Bradyrhizobium sp.]HMM92296.1 hypothetical protein [Bradyrhizobium sp.]
MKLVKTSAIAVAMSALLAGPVLAQGASSDAPIRGGAKGTTQMQDDMPAGAGSHKAGAKPGMKGTVGAAGGAPRTSGAPATPPASAR